MANFWLVKSEPNKYAFSDLVRDGKTVWDGVRNFAAAQHLKAMKVGDEVLYYHSQEGLAVVGIAKVVTEAFPDASDPSGRSLSLFVVGDQLLKGGAVWRVGRHGSPPIPREVTADAGEVNRALRGNRPSVSHRCLRTRRPPWRISGS